MGLVELLFGICRNGSRLEMYDVIFGGTKHMTKRLTIALVAVALFVLMAIMPVSALSNGTVINQGAFVFIGEEGLNVTHALNQALVGPYGPAEDAPVFQRIGWWASAAPIQSTSATKIIDLGVGSRYKSMTVAQTDFVGFTGNWYLVDAGGFPIPWSCGGPTCDYRSVFNVQDPTLSIAVWDFQQGTNTAGVEGYSGTDVTGKSVPQGEHLGFNVMTNMAPALDGTKRVNIIAWDSVETFPTNDNWSAWGNTAAAAWTNATPVSGVITLASTYTEVYPNTYGGINTYTVFRDTTLAQDDWDPAGWYDGSLVGVDQFQTLFQTQNKESDGQITLKVKDANGAVYSKLVVGNSVATVNYRLTRHFVDTQPWYYGNSEFYWVTDATDFNNQYLYPVGTYQAWAESILNKMKDNYKNAGADYTGKTVSGVGTITLVSDSVKIEANKDSVVRSKSFSVTVTGKPSTPYYLWVKGTNSMDSTYDNTPPMVNINQEKVYMDPVLGPYPIGAYQYENGAGATIRDDVAVGPITSNSTRYYCLINTSTSGTRTVEWVTNNWTKAQKYTFRVEQRFPLTAAYNAPGSSVKSDEVDVKVEKGAVTIVAAGDQSYYLGEEIKFSGTNTESYKTYLFLIGPNLPTQGARIYMDNPRLDVPGARGVQDSQANTFKVVDVNGDNTWSWKWGTSKIALDAGTYTIYAVSQPRDANNLENTAFGTVSIIIKKPFVSATASQSTVAQGDKIFITGTAEGNPKGVKIWILGKNYPTSAAGVKDESVNSDASFKYEVTQSMTRNLYPGQYFVVVQHPMQNNEYDVRVGPDGVSVINAKLNQVGTTIPTKVFTLLGAGSLQGSDAAEALVQGINDPNVDDTYTKLQFLVEVPVIRIDPIGDKHVGDKFTITAATNLAVDDEILVQVYSSSFKPTQKSQSGEFSGATGTVKVAKGDSGMNKISFDVDSSTFKPDEYIVTEEAILQVATGTALFNVLDGAAPVVTTKAPVVVTTVATAIPTTVATAVPTPIPTTKSPGYGALIALIGLGAVAFIVVRRH